MYNLKFYKLKDRECYGVLGIEPAEYNGEVTVPAEYCGLPVTRIMFESFKRSKITAITLPSTLVEIDLMAFICAASLTRVSIPDEAPMSTIGNFAFSGCNSLKEIRLPACLQEIGYDAFDNTHIILSSKTRVVNYLEGCTFERYGYAEPAIEEDENGNCFRLTSDKTGYIFERIGRYKGDTFSVPETYKGLPVVELGYHCFSKTYSPRGIEIPGTVVKAQDFPFYGCDDTDYAVYGGTLEQWRRMHIYTWFHVSCSDGSITPDD